MNCLSCDREIDTTEYNPTCPICEVTPLCEPCNTHHQITTHPQETNLEIPKRFYQFSQDHSDRVRMMAACNVPRETMAKIIGCGKQNLNKHYKYQMEQGADEATVNIAQKLYEVALGGNVNAMMFWLKEKGGWQGKHLGKDGELIPTALAEQLNEVERGQRIGSWLRAKKKSGQI